MIGFTIQVTFKNKNWKIVKRRNLFEKLHDKLKSDIKGDDKEFTIEFPKFKDHSDETEDEMQESMEALSNYLTELAKNPDVYSNQIFLEFCEVSSVTYRLRGAIVYKEGPVTKRSGGRYKQDSSWSYKYVKSCFRNWSTRWFVLTDQYLLFLEDSADDEPNECLLIDSNFHVIYGENQTGDELGITVINNHRKLELKAKDAFEFTTWLRAFRTAIENNGLQSRVRRSFDSFSPMRNNNHVEFFIDGNDYWNRLYEELMTAEKEVFITDWWLTPELYLKRPVNLYNTEMDEYRLDNVLAKIAEKGVKVWVLVWKEVEVGGMLYNSSQHVKDSLENMHENIIVQRHPANLIQFWSHHEKICVIDQKKAFAGGIDLCMGRYDTHSHPIKDKGDEDGNYLFPGKDYSNSRIKDFVEVKDTSEALISRNTTPRMPWHDLHLFVKGETAQDLAVHFIEYWNNAKIDVEGTKNKEGAFLRPVENLMDTMSKSRGKHIDGSVDDLHMYDEGEEFGIIGKDFIEYIVQDADMELEVDKGAEDLGKKPFT